MSNFFIMTILPIVVYGSPVLRAESVDVDSDYPGLLQLTEDMFETMYEAEGVGLAAPQVGKNIRLFVIDISAWAEDDPELEGFKRVFINPEIYEYSDETGLYNEGCLSLPGLSEDVTRPTTIRMRYLDENFEPHDDEFTGRPARVIQHEYDHLQGIVYADRLSPLRRSLLKSKLNNLTKGKYKAHYRTK